MMTHFLPQEVIAAKRDGRDLTCEQINFMVDGIASGEIGDGQIAAWAMAIFFQGMSLTESAALTLAMRDSGSVMNWDPMVFNGPIIDKHSTGGVGDLVSIVLGPIIAACGGYVPMISGRGLGHTGGTLDKLESITGYQVNPDQNQFKSALKDAGVAIIGAMADIAPADKRLYGIRDVTATVDSIALITASILSKKLAAGLDSLVMDVKVGSGAFMATYAQSERLARRIVAVGNRAGCRTSALLTDMSQPLGRNSGNALEIVEAMDYLTGHSGNTRLDKVTRSLGERMLTESQLAADAVQAQAMMTQALDSGEAAERFGRMVAGLGGPTDLLEQGAAHFVAAPFVAPLKIHQGGFIQAMDCKSIGMAIVTLGGGRTKPGQCIDSRVGLSGCREIGDYLQGGETLVTLHARDESSWGIAAQRILSAVTLGDEPALVPPIVYDCIAPSMGREEDL